MARNINRNLIILIIAVVAAYVLINLFSIPRANRMKISKQPDETLQTPETNTQNGQKELSQKEKEEQQKRKEVEEKIRIEEEKKRQNKEYEKPENYPIKTPSSNKIFKIGVLPLYGTKVPSIPNHPSMTFHTINLDYRETYNYWPSKGFFNTVFGFGYRIDDKEKANYTDYQEDMVLTYTFVELEKKSDFYSYDFIFVPPIGVEFTEEIVNNLYQFVNSGVQSVQNYCYLQSYVPLEDRKKFGLTNSKYLFDVDWPEKSFRTMSGMFFVPENLKKVVMMMRSIHYLNRFDLIMQHYCEVIDSPILISPYNIYEPLKLNSYN